MGNPAQGQVVLAMLPYPLPITFTAARKRFIKPDGSGYPASGGNAIGVSQFPGVSGDKIDIARSGFLAVTAGGAINPGDWVMSDATGQAVVATPLAIAAGAVAVTSVAANGATDIVGGQPPVVVLGQYVGTVALAAGDDALIYM